MVKICKTASKTQKNEVLAYMEGKQAESNQMSMFDEFSPDEENSEAIEVLDDLQEMEES